VAVNTAKLHFRDRVRRLAPLVAAAAAMLACVAASPALAQSNQHHHGGGGPRGGGGPGWGPAGAPRGGFGREAPMGGPVAGPVNGPPGGRPLHGPNWDGRKYNGYFVGGRWYYGAPQQPAYETPGFRPGFTPWRRGSFLPPQYQTYEVYDFDRFHLRRPPNGYHWVQVGGEFLLVSVSTGLIFDVVQGG
jgi:Ni/Co efflux regulator RcnB